MPDDNMLDQNEIERLLSGGGGPKESMASTPAPEKQESNTLGQSDLDALLSGLAGNAPTPPSIPEATPAPIPEPNSPPITPDSAPILPAAPDAGALAQDEIESLLKKLEATTSKPAPAPTTAPSTFAPLSSFTNPAQNVQAGTPPTGLASTPPGWVPSPQSPAQPSQARPGNAALGHLAVPATVTADEEGMPQGDIDYLLNRAEEALDSIASGKAQLPTEVIEFQFPEFGGSVPNVEHATLDQISEVELDIKIELGRTNMYLEDVLKLRKGAVVPLDKLAGEAVDVYVNGRLLARGEILVMNENFCVRIGELLAGAIPLE